MLAYRSTRLGVTSMAASSSAGPSSVASSSRRITTATARTARRAYILATQSTAALRRHDPCRTATWLRPASSAAAAAVATPSSSSASFTNPPRRSTTPSSISTELLTLQSSLTSLLGSSHPSLDEIAKYYFRSPGKNLRPMIVLLISQATNGLGGGWDELRERERNRVGREDESLTSVEGVLNDWNPEVMGTEKAGDMVFGQPFVVKDREDSGVGRLRTSTDSASSTSTFPTDNDTTTLPILSTQRRLASITEMIHVASLLHDDVIDTSPLRRNSPSAPAQFGNKLSILSGDFLLGRASVALARLGNNEVVELLATVIANLVEGEVLQLRSPIEGMTSAGPSEEAFELYMRKTYLKTASLMAKSARAAVILGGCGQGRNAWVKEAAYAYGRNLGIAFQLIDDMLDFLPPSPTLGKPSLGADLSLGLTTAPSLFAWRTQPTLGPLIARKFSEPGDVELARELVARSDGLERTRELAGSFAQAAREALGRFPEGEAKDSLIGLTEKVVERVA